jgi:hypothetical protein
MRRAKRAVGNAKKQYTIRGQRELVSVMQVKPRMMASDRLPESLASGRGTEKTNLGGDFLGQRLGGGGGSTGKPNGKTWDAPGIGCIWGLGPSEAGT